MSKDKATCRPCHGIGSCSHCGGAGQRHYNQGYNETCRGCFGTRKCVTCGGRGER